MEMENMKSILDVELSRKLTEPIKLTYSNIEGGAPLETARVLLQHRLNLFLQKLVNLHTGKNLDR